MEDNSYYISYHANNGNESASFCYYYDVHKDGFSFDNTKNKFDTENGFSEMFNMFFVY